MAEFGFETVTEAPLSMVAGLGYDLAQGAISRDDMLSRTANVLMALRGSNELVADRFSVLEQSNLPLLPSTISIVTAGILTARETDEENIPKTLSEAIENGTYGVFGEEGMDEAENAGKMLRVFLIGLEKGGFNRTQANRYARDEVETFLAEYDGRTSYSAVAGLRYFYGAMNTADIHSIASKFKMYRRAVQMATKCGAEII